MTISCETIQATVTIEEDKTSGDLMLPIPQEFLVALGWTEGDELDLTENADGSFSLTRIPK